MIRRDALLFGLAAAFALSTSAFALDRALTDEEQQMIANINALNSAIRTMVPNHTRVTGRKAASRSDAVQRDAAAVRAGAGG
jgi:hypothetical protein